MHPSLEQILRYFDYEHLKVGPLRDTSSVCHDLAYEMVDNLPHSSELTAGLRKLLEAKDCFVRCALDIPPDEDD